jgi:hypothetical protein
VLEPIPLGLSPEESAVAAEAPPSGLAAPTTDGVPAERREPTPARRRERGLVRLGVVGAILAFVMLALLYVYATPTYRPPDEAGHVAYAQELSHGRLPTLETPISTEGDSRLRRLLSVRNAPRRTIWTANHPPLYYAFAAVPLRIGTETAHPTGGVQAARLLSVAWSALGLAVLAYLVLQLVPGRPQLAVAATGLAAVLPGFVGISSVVYNDSLAFLTSTAALAAAVVFVVRGPSRARLAVVAASAGLVALTRASGLLVVGVVGLAVLYGVWRDSQGSHLRRLGRAVVWAGAVAVVVVGVAGWFYVRNLTLYGDLTGSAALLERFDRVPGRTIPGLLTSPGFWRVQQQHLWDLTYDLPRANGSLTRQLWLLGFLPLAGLLVAWGRWLARPAHPATRSDQGRRVAVVLCVVLLGLLQLSVVQFVSSGGGAHARYLFPGLVTLGLAGAVGLTALPGGLRGLPVVAMLLAMGAANLWVWSQYLDALKAAQRPAMLVAALPLLLVGLGLQAIALWRLAPQPDPDPARPGAVRPGQDHTPDPSPTQGSPSQQHSTTTPATP